MKNEMKAKEGMWLTQATLDNEDERQFWKAVSSYGPLNVRDASQEEKDKWDAEHPAEINE
jgi:hypothetical protein